MKKFPEGYPLKPCDSSGNKVMAGDLVTILAIPSHLVDDLCETSKQNIENCIGKTMSIIEIDDYGYLWFSSIVTDNEEEYKSDKFCLEPVYVQKKSI